MGFVDPCPDKRTNFSPQKTPYPREVHGPSARARGCASRHVGMDNTHASVTRTRYPCVHAARSLVRHARRTRQRCTLARSNASIISQHVRYDPRRRPPTIVRRAPKCHDELDPFTGQAGGTDALRRVAVPNPGRRRRPIEDKSTTCPALSAHK
jgi:hypothetical protein